MVDCSTAVTVVPCSCAENHSRIVASSPAETADMWPFTMLSGIPSAWHFATITLESTLSSFANSKIRFCLAKHRSRPTRDDKPEPSGYAARLHRRRRTN